MKKYLLIALCALIPLSVFGEATPTPTPTKLEAAFADVLTKSVQTVGEAKDFLVAQLPDVIRQLLLWKLFEYLVPMVVFFVLALAATRFTFKYGADLEIESLPPPNDYYSTISAQRAKNGWPKFAYECARVVLCFVAWMVFLAYANLTWLQIWIAPKIYLIEYARSFVK